MASFQAIIRGEMPRKGENKTIVLFRSNLTFNRKFQKNRKKLKKIPLWLNLKPKKVEKGRERRKTKIIVPFRSYATRNRKFQTNSKKIQKIIKYYYGFISSHNKGGNAEKWRK